MKNCIFCKVITNKTTNHTYDIVPEKKLKSLVVLETPNFFVSLDIAPLKENHCLIVTKRHVTSFSLLDKNELDEFKGIKKILDNIFLKKYGFRPTFFEHGLFKPRQGGVNSCIDHAHVHVLPMKTDLTKQIEGDGFKLAKLGEYGNKKFADARSGSYLFYQSEGCKKGKFYTSKIIPSQYFRKIISEIEGNTNWNWKTSLAVIDKKKAAKKLIKSYKFLSKRLSKMKDKIYL